MRESGEGVARGRDEIERGGKRREAGGDEGGILGRLMSFRF